ncbi:hypothetical protein Pst134EA_022534 [Puccinia striiformis f. sp. tritici]|uniref:hypothetical protein n=1 Tax=Puccinia striiformis f. sp. tritici TaxID=168172 RepID=UPI0020072623|nr:hypothetical protein Pst134EA_022534 [Puccinia striiformis f. sp. tritici]KAH9455058.1 hypothetical protein Pst134EA_022534 [Puccinia striiformis f. sp. tritici]
MMINPNVEVCLHPKVPIARVLEQPVRFVCLFRSSARFDSQHLPPPFSIDQSVLRSLCPALGDPLVHAYSSALPAHTLPIDLGDPQASRSLLDPDTSAQSWIYPSQHLFTDPTVSCDSLFALASLQSGHLQNDMTHESGPAYCGPRDTPHPGTNHRRPPNAGQITPSAVAHHTASSTVIWPMGPAGPQGSGGSYTRSHDPSTRIAPVPPAHDCSAAYQAIQDWDGCGSPPPLPPPIDYLAIPPASPLPTTSAQSSTVPKPRAASKKRALSAKKVIESLGVVPNPVSDTSPIPPPLPSITQPTTKKRPAPRGKKPIQAQAQARNPIPETLTPTPHVPSPPGPPSAPGIPSAETRNNLLAHDSEPPPQKTLHEADRRATSPPSACSYRSRTLARSQLQRLPRS